MTWNGRRPDRCAARVALAVALLLGTCAAAAQGGAPTSYIGRPVYSEPGAGLQMPPGCRVEPGWRARVENSDLELWVVDCEGEVRAWVLRRSTLEMVTATQARLRFQVTDERRLPGETAGDSASVRCVGRNTGESGFVVIGARWKPAGSELRLTGVSAVLRVDPGTQAFVASAPAQVDCVRHPEREALLRRLQQR